MDQLIIEKSCISLVDKVEKHWYRRSMKPGYFVSPSFRPHGIECHTGWTILHCQRAWIVDSVYLVDHQVCVYGEDCFWLEENCGMLAKENGEFLGEHVRTKESSKVRTFGLYQIGLVLLGGFHSTGDGNHF
jgi:hypothetical protein